MNIVALLGLNMALSITQHGKASKSGVMEGCSLMRCAGQVEAHPSS
jgi:hypothetical protein